MDKVSTTSMTMISGFANAAGYDRKPPGRANPANPTARKTVGPAVFLAVGLAGFALPGGFLSYPAGHAKPLIIAIEAVLTLSIAVILGLLVAGPPERERRR